LLAEFLDMDNQYAVGERHVNAEHFAHGPFYVLGTPLLFGLIRRSRCFLL
jgi:hypothetical protein